MLPNRDRPPHTFFPPPPHLRRQEGGKKTKKIQIVGIASFFLFFFFTLEYVLTFFLTLCFVFLSRSVFFVSSSLFDFSPGERMASSGTRNWVWVCCPKTNGLALSTHTHAHKHHHANHHLAATSATVTHHRTSRVDFPGLGVASNFFPASPLSSKMTGNPAPGRATRSQDP